MSKKISKAKKANREMDLKRYLLTGKPCVMECNCASCVEDRKNPDATRAAFYVRYGVLNGTVEEQIKRCAKACKEKIGKFSFRVYIDYCAIGEDVELSISSLNKMMNDIKEGKIDIVVTTHPEMFIGPRPEEETIAFEMALLELGANLLWAPR